MEIKLNRFPAMCKKSRLVNRFDDILFFMLLIGDENADGTTNWRKKILFLLLCYLLVVLGLLVALMIVIVKLAQKKT